MVMAPLWPSTPSFLLDQDVSMSIKNWEIRRGRERESRTIGLIPGSPKRLQTAPSDSIAKIYMYEKLKLQFI